MSRRARCAVLRLCALKMSGLWAEGRGRPRVLVVAGGAGERSEESVLEKARVEVLEVVMGLFF